VRIHVVTICSDYEMDSDEHSATDCHEDHSDGDAPVNRRRQVRPRRDHRDNYHSSSEEESSVSRSSGSDPDPWQSESDSEQSEEV